MMHLENFKRNYIQLHVVLLSQFRCFVQLVCLALHHPAILVTWSKLPSLVIFQRLLLFKEHLCAYVLTGECRSCKTQYMEDHESFVV